MNFFERPLTEEDLKAVEKFSRTIANDYAVSFEELVESVRKLFAQQSEHSNKTE